VQPAEQNFEHYARNRITVALYSLTVTMVMPSRMESMAHEHIAPELRDLAVPVDSLQQDPKNLRLHNKRSIKSVAGSLERFGQRIPIVTRNGIVIAGNARLAAAIQLGWSHIACVSADNDDDMTARLFAITDNRTSDLSEFDMSGLASVLATLKDENLDLDSLGWDDKELAKILDLDPLDDDDNSASQKDMEYIFKLVITCDDEDHQAALFERLRGEGLKCQMLMS
jgi:ParB-like chromosome segregation protein Spo0J